MVNGPVVGWCLLPPAQIIDFFPPPFQLPFDPESPSPSSSSSSSPPLPTAPVVSKLEPLNLY